MSDYLPGPDYLTVFDEAPAPMILLTPDFVIVRANRARLAVTATTHEGTVGRNLFDVFPMNPTDPAADGLRNLSASLALTRDSKQPQTMALQKYDIPLPDGTYEERYWSPRNVPILDEHGEVALLLHRSDDITDYVRLREGSDGLDAEAHRWRERAQEVEADLLARTQELQVLNRQLLAARDELTHQALHDSLTGLLVRAPLLETLTRTLARLERHPGAVAVLFLDLDNLKQVNDSHGHAAGDALIRRTASRLTSVVRPTDVVARLGGDEFVVVLEDLATDAAVSRARAVANRLLVTLREPCEVAAGVLVRPSASIGIAVADGRPHAPGPAHDGQHGDFAPLPARARAEADKVLSQADTAMYWAKREGRGRHHFYDAATDAALRARTELEEQLRTALAEHQLRLHYQPIVDLADGSIHGVEALVRWQHPAGGVRAAGTFIEVADGAGLLPSIGRWVVDEACRQLAQWDRELGADSPARLFLNLAPSELARPDLLHQLKATLDAHDLEPGRLVLEVTEGGTLEGSQATDTLLALKSLGCHLAIDDFGTGYSSLSRVVQLPVDHLKIDRTLVHGLDHDLQARAVADAVLALARNLRQTVVAEGVEQQQDLDVLRELRCPLAQGFHLSMPQDPERLTAQLRRAG